MFKNIWFGIGLVISTALIVAALRMSASPAPNEVTLVSIIDNYPRHSFDKEFEYKLADRFIVPSLANHRITVSNTLSGEDLRNQFGSIGAGLEHSLKRSPTQRVLIVRWENFGSSSSGEVHMTDYQIAGIDGPILRWQKSRHFSTARQDIGSASEGLLSEYAALFDVRYASQPQTFPAQ